MKKLLVSLLLLSFFDLYASQQSGLYSFHMKTFSDIEKQKIFEKFIITVKDNPLIDESIGTAHGRIKYCDEKRVCFLEYMSVVEEYRQQGIGKEIMGMVKNYAISEQCESIKLNSTFTAHRFYQKLGFSKNGETAGTIPYTLSLSQTDV